MAIYENITELIGNTPIVKLNRLVPEGAADGLACHGLAQLKATKL